MIYRSIWAQLNHIPDDEENKTRLLSWIVVYIGYTEKKTKKTYQYKRYEIGGSFRDCQYLLRNMFIMNITKLSNVHCAKYIVSIFASFYSKYNGLNGTLGSFVVLETRVGIANIAYLQTKELETDIQIIRNVGRLVSLMNINDRLVKLRERVASNVPPLSMDRSDIESQADDGLVSSSPIPTTQMTRLSTNDDRTLK
ncbi:hypothetical protein EAE99_008015 [Botrytis elliptica]|nr:hypothetical protein EAE99_008015 [Botrytis elliptica]